MKCSQCQTLNCEEGLQLCCKCRTFAEEEGMGSLKDLAFDRGRSEPSVDSALKDLSDEEDFVDASDSVLDCCSEQEDASQSSQAGCQGDTKAQPTDDGPSPGEIKVHHISTDCVTLGWDPPEPSMKWSYEVTLSSCAQKESLRVQDSNTIDFEGLRPGTEYIFNVVCVSESGVRSKAFTSSCYTMPMPPEKLRIDHVTSDSVCLSWHHPDGEVGEYHVNCSRDGEDTREKTTVSNSLTFSSLRPGVKYTFRASTLLTTGPKSQFVAVYVHTKTVLENLLLDLGLDFKEKLTLSTVLQIDEKTISGEPAHSLTDLPWYFLKRLMMVNVTARSGKCVSTVDESGCDASFCSSDFELESLVGNQDVNNMVNPLDIVAALFLCSNGFLQQEMTLKMSMCQFSVPLLLPNCDSDQCTFMLWALRDIVKKYRPHSLDDPKGFVENRVVLSDLPMVSFVRLGECSLSKSQIINKLLSNPQQYHDTFVHHDMECGDSPRRISNGLVEISWYLPCGNKNIDIFGEPVAVANLRGDIGTFETQYSFLCQTSVAVFVFFDNLDYSLLTSQHTKAQLFLIGNPQSPNFNIDVLKKTASGLNLKKNNIILKTKQMNDADFVKNLRNTVGDVIKNCKFKMQLEKMSDVAHELGILVDEDCQECQTAKQNAFAITSNIPDIFRYKESQLPLQGQIWKELARLEKEECRLRKVGDKNIEIYKSELQTQKTQLRKKQAEWDMSGAMTCFINAISTPGLERSYFLKWMRMNLDNLSRESLSGLREQYKEKCQNSSENKEDIKDLDKQISNSSLGTEHFLREMGQLYESSVLLPEGEVSRQQLLHLPKLCAELLLDGYPLELVDGDASNIPLRWVSDVLCELDALVKPKNKIMVITVLGVQSTGKSTLLNAMFGVQFAVSSGRCTRGAFMLLIKVKEDFKKQLDCDFVVIIDTEGLKSPELAQLDDSHEHDNELATLVIGLSDITIINIAMENSTEMKDILQIVVHAFLRMKEVGKKPKCQFVHQNVSDVSAHDKNMRDRKMLLEQLNEMTQAAAKMENKEENKNFTDVIEYNPDTGNWYIPGLWHGNPPMAPVNAGYSEAVFELKRNMVQVLQRCDISKNNIMEFLEWTKSLWNAVKYENFIFSFRNSLVADAYMKLCTKFNKWEWEFRKHMYTWVANAQTKISNFRTILDEFQTSDIEELLVDLKSKALSQISKWEKILLDNLTKYYEQTEGHVCLVEGYRETFSNTAKSLRREMENSVLNQLEAAVEIRKGMCSLETIKENHTIKLEQRVLELLEECRKSKVQKSDKDLDRDFDKMWDTTVKELSFKGLDPKDVVEKVLKQLRLNLKQSPLIKTVNNIKLNQCGVEPFDVPIDGFFKKVKHAVINMFYLDDHISKLQALADSIIYACLLLINDKVQKETDYHDNDIQEVLHIIDERLSASRDPQTNCEFEVKLKLHICGIASRQFQEMHGHFIEVNDPRRCLEQYRNKYHDDFKDLFNKRDQCKTKAEEFTQLCLKPAVEANVLNSLGPDIVDEMLTGRNALQFSTRAFFQYSVLKHLISEFRFENYVSYIVSYEEYVKKWIYNQIKEHLSNGLKIWELQQRHLKANIQNITDAITKMQKDKNCNLEKYVQNICKELGNTLVIPKDALSAFMILNNADQEQFAQWLKKSIEEMEQSLMIKLQKQSVQSILEALRIKPQDILFNRVFGCGMQCPFCKAPCEAGGKAHTDHFASVHRPQGLGTYRFLHSRKLDTDICSSLVFCEGCFCCYETDEENHPYKKYQEIYPDWHIPADPSIQASDYWKYVMTHFNKKFAKEYKALPADIPPAWKNITKEQAENSLKECFSIK
ncbi:interferon-induced very large GTPase 1 isoform X2 [Osmerus eperlanus]|uniref:interferon-induced very large GTPase 1 isoform X2 n=1 Tax=Osmerus eperlanus TaxID=29151 RepID=UPI002E15F529